MFIDDRRHSTPLWNTFTHQWRPQTSGEKTRSPGTHWVYHYQWANHYDSKLLWCYSRYVIRSFLQCQQNILRVLCWHFPINQSIHDSSRWQACVYISSYRWCGRSHLWSFERSERVCQTTTKQSKSKSQTTLWGTASNPNSNPTPNTNPSLTTKLSQSKSQTTLWGDRSSAWCLFLC